MTLNQFIFSPHLKHRLARHLAFWTIFSLHFIIQNLMIGGPGEAKTSRTFLESFLHFLYFLPTYLLSTYFFIKVLLPKFLYRGRYTSFVILFLLLFAFSFTAIYYSGAFYLHHITKLAYSQINFNANKYHAIVDGLFVPFMLLAIAAGINFSKKWFLQQRENERLAKQKLATELQLLKTSLHPRFLFHSLQTVQKHIDKSSAQSPSLILQLSDLLSYILYEKDESWVPLQKELEIVRSYINLEEKSFEDKRLFKTKFPATSQDKFIVPFLLLSLVESCFEYFLDTGQNRPLLTLICEVNENVLHFGIVFSKHIKEPPETKVEERFLRVQKQLQNQYPNRHHWKVAWDDETVSIDVKLPLYQHDLIDRKKKEPANEPSAFV